MISNYYAEVCLHNVDWSCGALTCVALRCIWKDINARRDKYRENDCGWRTSNPNTSLTQFLLDKRIPYGALMASGFGLVLSPSAHVGSGNHGDMVLIHHDKRHDAYDFILETPLLFSGGFPIFRFYLLTCLLTYYRLLLQTPNFLFTFVNEHAFQHGCFNVFILFIRKRCIWVCLYFTQTCPCNMQGVLKTV